ncbi:two-component system, response regulator YesN [Gracilibacillus orientalis]|uniref:Two-component system, response regulator YesN n=1 Tax=Gracilibacillus orientalis TaxID=334253 RepID=A0A1I4HUS9_9BACI|nr:response regulator [Gracilibacillus orientalis]SFL45929.1 two-component system, response regulator YesN [Gracilibacillus orientalis]
MWKLFIAEDESIIRRGLKKSLNWESYSINVIGEAEDGEEALNKAIELRPDILFIDINMPFLNGLELMEKLRSILPDAVFIVISGYNEFIYAQKAIKMGTIDYILKPVKKPELEQSIENAVDILTRRSRNRLREKQLEGNKQLLKEKFLLSWSLGHYQEDEMKKHAKLLGVSLTKNTGLLVFKVIKEINIGSMEQNWSDVLLSFSIKNIISDLLSGYQSKEMFEDQSGHIVLLLPQIDTEFLFDINQKIVLELERFLGKVVTCRDSLLTSSLEFPNEYKKVVSDLKSANKMTPIVALAKNYIDQHYYSPSISLQQVASYVQVNPTYLSKQIKNELGVSFIQYLKNVRINKALILMKDPYLKIYEVAEMVGYSTQHYFCNAFKKVVGISPTVYRTGEKLYE